MRLDARYVLQPDKLDKIPSDNKGYKKAGLENTNAKSLGLEDFYLVNIMNYCQGTFSVKGDDEHGVWSIDKCHGVKTGFTFQPVTLLSQGKALEDKIPQKVRDAQKYMDSLWHFMVGSFITGFGANIVTFIIGWFGLLSRWGSFITTLFAVIAAVGTFMGAVLSTILMNSLKLAFEKTKEDFAVTATVFVRPVYYSWAAWVFSAGAVIFWTASACCCSGRTKAVMGGEEKAATPASTAGFGGLIGKVKGAVGGGKQGSYVPLGETSSGYGQQGHSMDTFNTGYGQQNSGYGQQSSGYGQQSTGYGPQTAGAFEPYAHK